MKIYIPFLAIYLKLCLGKRTFNLFNMLNPSAWEAGLKRTAKSCFLYFNWRLSAFSFVTVSCITIKGKVFGPLSVNINERFNDCHNVPIPKHPAIYLHKANWVNVNSGAARQCPVRCVSRPLWFLSSIVSRCSFTAGVVPGPMSSFFCRQWSEVVPVISIAQLCLLLWNPL